MLTNTQKDQTEALLATYKRTRVPLTRYERSQLRAGAVPSTDSIKKVEAASMTFYSEFRSLLDTPMQRRFDSLNRQITYLIRR